MAKLNAPLFSFNASGQIAKALVYFGWKGLDVVRSYVVPTNPKTAAQVAQRAHMTAVVAKIHAAQARATNPFDEADQVAYAALGSTRPTPRTWFNEVVKLWIDCEILSDIPVVYSDGEITDKAADSINLRLWLNEKTASQLAAGKVFFGISRTALIHPAAATIIAGVHVRLEDEDCSAFLTAGTKYYWQFKPDAADPCEGANSGIYNFVAT